MKPRSLPVFERNESVTESVSDLSCLGPACPWDKWPKLWYLAIVGVVFKSFSRHNANTSLIFKITINQITGTSSGLTANIRK